MTRNQYFNYLNDKYNIYSFEITNVEEAKEFYTILATVYELSLPCCPITEKEMDLALEAINK